MTSVVNLKGCQNLSDPAYTGEYVYIGRPSVWGNPFVIGRDGTRTEVIERYRRWLQTQPELLNLIPSLRGKILGCWCKPLACHGDVLAALADAPVHD